MPGPTRDRRYRVSDWKLSVGKMSDRAVARLFGIGATTVRRYRHSKGIPEFYPRDDVIPPGLSMQLATETNYRLSTELKISLERIRNARTALGIPEPKIARARFAPLENVWSDEAISLLGTMPDTEIADKLGISNFPVKKKRRELGVPAYRRAMPEITSEMVSEFGVVSDAELAQRLGVSANYVRRARVKMRS